MQLVLIEGDVVWSSAENFRELAACGATEEIHLPQAILCGRVALTEVEIFVILRFDVRYAALVAPNGDARLDALDLNRVLLGRGWRDDQKTNRYQEEDSKTSHT
jgi:hypothetical protein